MAKAWCKVAADLDSHPKVRRAGRAGREVFLFVLRRNAALDLGGRVPRVHVEPWYLADQLLMPEDEATAGLSQAIRTGLLTDDGFSIGIVGWDDEWSKGPLTEAERKRKQRERSREAAPDSTSPAVDQPDDTPGVRTVSGQDRDGPECHGSEEKRRDYALPRAPARDPSAGARASRRMPIPADWTPSADERELGEKLGLDVDAECREFVAYWLGEGKPKRDWNQTFRARLEKRGEYAKRQRDRAPAGEEIRQIGDL